MITEIVGIIGGLFIFLAFIEVASGKWNGNSFWYEAFNLAGGGSAIVLRYRKTSIHKYRSKYNLDSGGLLRNLSHSNAPQTSSQNEEKS